MKAIERLRFDVGDIVSKARQLARRHVDGISIELPFVTIDVKPDNTERRVAHEVAIRLSDRRVLKAAECCDNCIDQALASLQGVREILVDKQVELYETKDGALYLLLEMMAEGLRQFLTFEQRLHRLHRDPIEAQHPDFRRSQEAREAYFAALEVLRSHLLRCLLEVAKIGQVTLPKTTLADRYQTPWPVEQYRTLELPKS